MELLLRNAELTLFSNLKGLMTKDDTIFYCFLVWLYCCTLAFCSFLSFHELQLVTVFCYLLCW